jgi:hypothetical protein
MSATTRRYVMKSLKKHRCVIFFLAVLLVCAASYATTWYNWLDRTIAIKGLQMGYIDTGWDSWNTIAISEVPSAGVTYKAGRILFGWWYGESDCAQIKATTTVQRPTAGTYYKSMEIGAYDVDVKSYQGGSKIQLSHDGDVIIQLGS